MENQFREIFEKSPIGIIFHDKKGNVIKINESAAKIMGISKFEDITNINLFDNPLIEANKEKLIKNGLIRFQAPLDFERIKEFGPYYPTKSGLLFLDYIVSITDSGYLVQIQDISNQIKVEKEFSDNQKKFELFADAASSLLSSENPVKIVSYICNKAMKYLDCDVFFNYLFDEKEQRLHLNAYAGVEEEIFKSIEWLDLGVAVCGCVGRDGCPIVEEDIQNNYNDLTELVRSFGVQAYACHPIISKGKTIGILSFGTKSKMSFSENEIGVMNVITNYVATAMERKLSEEELKESFRASEADRNSLNTLISTIPSAVVILEQPDGKISFINERAKELYGMDPTGLKIEEHPKLGLLKLDGTPYRGDEMPASRSLLNGEIVRNEDLILEQPDGNHIFVSASSAPIYNPEGEISAVIGVFEDITDRKELEEELKQARDHLEEQVEERTAELEEAYQTLKESEVKYRSLFENAPVGIFHSTIDGKYIDVNPELSRILGYDSPEDLISTVNKSSIPDVIYVNKDLRPEYLESVFHTDDWFRTENYYRRKDGEVIIGDLNFKNVGSDYKGNVLLEGFMTDITDRIKSENELKETVSELERSNEELESFAYITSHDLQEPLRTIASYAQLIERRYKGQLDKDADEFLDFLVAGAKRMKDQIQGLLDYSRVGTKGEEFREFNVEDAVNNALSNLKTNIEENNAKITYNNLPVIFADESQISRIFQNLIGNALKFRKKEEAPKIHISSCKIDGEYIFSIADNGIGIEEQYTERIFEVFKRLHAIGEYEGAGIGLSIVKRIILRHGGHTWVESKYGKGSIFYFTLPVLNE